MDAKARSDRQARRRRQILSATLRLLRRHGTGITTAQIAAEAHCSKETLYNWFKDRDGIFLTLVEEQAQAMSDALAKSIAKTDGMTFRDKLEACCIALLDLMTGEAVIAVNRAAMAQACRERADLGLAVIDDWQARVAVPFQAVIDEGVISGAVRIADVGEAFDTLTALLLGDRQRRLLLGEESRPAGDDMANMAAMAVSRWMRIYG